MAATDPRGSTEPLLPPKLASVQPTEPLSPTASSTAKILSVIKIAVGASCIIAPRWTCGLFFFPVPAAYTLLPRMFGVRDIILGELLLTAPDKDSPDGGKREIKRALWANIAVDAVDVGSLAFGLATGTIARLPATTLTGAAVAALGLAGVTMRGLRD